MAPGEERTVSVRLDEAFSGGFEWRMVGVPSTVSREFGCTRGLGCSLALQTEPATIPGVFLLELSMRRGIVERRAAVALNIRSTVPPTVAPPSAPTPTISARDLSVRAAVLVRTIAPGSTSVFGLDVTQGNWTGPITFTVEGVSTEWSANASPNPAEALSNHVQPPDHAQVRHHHRHHRRRSARMDDFVRC